MAPSIHWKADGTGAGDGTEMATEEGDGVDNKRDRNGRDERRV